MKQLHFPSVDPAAQLACDEAVLNWCEQTGEAEVLRFWEPATPFVVLGIGNHAGREADLAECAALGVPVFRRCSGGGAVLQAPGCFNFSLVLRIPAGENPLNAQALHRRVLDAHRDAIRTLLRADVQTQGVSDLTLGALKFSGNAQKRRLRSALYHGTFLFEINFDLMEKVLRFPSRRPEYRRDRGHRNFLTTLPAAVRPSLVAALGGAWNVSGPLEGFPFDAVQELVAGKYSQPSWNLKI